MRLDAVLTFRAPIGYRALMSSSWKGDIREISELDLDCEFTDTVEFCSSLRLQSLGEFSEANCYVNDVRIFDQEAIERLANPETFLTEARLMAGKLGEYCLPWLERLVAANRALFGYFSLPTTFNHTKTSLLIDGEECQSFDSNIAYAKLTVVQTHFEKAKLNQNVLEFTSGKRQLLAGTDLVLRANDSRDWYSVISLVAIGLELASKHALSSVEADRYRQMCNGKRNPTFDSVIKELKGKLDDDAYRFLELVREARNELFHNPNAAEDGAAILEERGKGASQNFHGRAFSALTELYRYRYPDLPYIKRFQFSPTR